MILQLWRPAQRLCVAPLEDGTVCGRPAVTSVVVEDLVCALCQEHADELDRDREEEERLGTRS